MIEIKVDDNDFIIINGAKWKGIAFKRALKDWIEQ